jgi:hypothetical protein
MENLHTEPSKPDRVIPPRMQGYIVCSQLPTRPQGSNNQTRGQEARGTQGRNEVPPTENTSHEAQSSQRQEPNMNTTNLRTNGIYGNKMQLPKLQNISRLVSLNINGFRRANEFQDASKIAHLLKLSSADPFNFQETNLRENPSTTI